MKLYPPYIEGTIPAFYQQNIETTDGQGTVVGTLTIPYEMNRAVGFKDIKGFSLKVKTLQGQKYILDLESTNFNEKEVKFDIIKKHGEQNILNAGQYYKVQLAYISKSDIIGYYSTIGIVKYTKKPEVTISGLEKTNLNNHKYEYIGLYDTTNADFTERIYSSEFKVWDYQENLIYNSDIILHNHTLDTDTNVSSDSWMVPDDLEENKIYYIQYITTTMNKMVVKSPKYRIMQRKTIDADIDVVLQAENIYDDGCIEITTQSLNDKLITGTFMLSRADSRSNFTTWNRIYNFTLEGEKIKKKLWRDYTIEQGVTYKYSVQQYNDNGLYSNRILTEEVLADFEDAFLFDGEKQLRIRFNPKVSSFKTNLLETKVDTIGGKHPFIFRNGHVNYKDFPISGLISYQMDEANLFMDKEELTIEEKTQNLTTENIYSERHYKLAVLDWLNNGKIKLFRSPAEGNYIVRLMNVSLSPQDSLGRMLHTFNCNAYEMAEYNFANLESFGIITFNAPPSERIRWETIEFINVNTENEQYNYKLNAEGTHYELLSKYIGDNLYSTRTAYTVEFRDILPGSRVKILMENDNEYREIQIGVTGAYMIETKAPIVSILIPKELLEDAWRNHYPKQIVPMYSGSVTYSYYSATQNVFDKIADMRTVEVPIAQYIGQYKNVLDTINNAKTELVKILNMRFSLRPVQKAYFIVEYANNHPVSSGYYKDAKGLEKIDSNNVDSYAIYQVYTKTQDGGFKASEVYIDPINSLNKVTYSTKVQIDDAEIELAEIENYTVNMIWKPKKIVLGSGTILEMSYQFNQTEYLIEDKNNGLRISNDKLLKELWQLRESCEICEAKYQEALAACNDINNSAADCAKVLTAKNQYNSNYALYIQTLEEVLKLWDEGEIN